MSKINLYALTLLLLLVQLSVGCSAKYKRDGSRQGWFAELSGGMAVVSANEEWTTHKYSGVPPQPGPQAALIRRPTEIQRIDHNERLFPKSPALNAKVGFGVSDRLIILLQMSANKIQGIGPGFTLFVRETAPSLFLDIFLPIRSNYFATKSSKIIIREEKYEFPISHSVHYVETHKPPLTGQAISIGIGYEFMKHWTVKMDFNIGLGVYSYDISKSTQFSYPRSPGAVDTYTVDTPRTATRVQDSLTRSFQEVDTYTVDTPRTATAYSVGFTIGYIWY